MVVQDRPNILKENKNMRWCFDWFTIKLFFKYKIEGFLLVVKLVKTE